MRGSSVYWKPTQNNEADAAIMSSSRVTVEARGGAAFGVRVCCGGSEAAGC